ncbi:MAG: hypothetical protein U1D67_09290 [Dehalococcoidia bacterium]|nr:hypothetical protein [Dehalococcoidia bacterium]
MASEEMRRVILDEINKLKNQNNAFNAGEFVQFNKLQEKKKDSVEMFFQLLSNLGVDPSDLGSINEFLSRLEQTNPDLFIMFESAFKRIFGEEAIGQQEGGPTAPPVSPDMAAATPPPSMVTEGVPLPGGEMPGGQMPGNGGGMPPVSESPAGPEAGQAPGLMGRFSNLQEQLLRK